MPPHPFQAVLSPRAAARLGVQPDHRRSNRGADGRWRPGPTLAELAAGVAELRGKAVARVKAAEALSDTQRDALARKLEQIYGREMAIHSEVDPSLLGGMVVRVGDEVIDGSTRGKLDRLRTDMAAQAAK